MDYQNFYTRLRKARKEAGFSRDELGKKIGKAGNIISRYETGSVQIPFLTFLDFVEAVGKPPAWFFVESVEDLSSLCSALEVPLHDLLIESGLISGEPAPPVSVEEAIRLDPSLDSEAKSLLLAMYRRICMKPRGQRDI